VAAEITDSALKPQTVLGTDVVLLAAEEVPFDQSTSPWILRSSVCGVSAVSVVSAAECSRVWSNVHPPTVAGIVANLTK